MAKVYGNYQKSASGLIPIPPGILEYKNFASPAMIKDVDTEKKTVTGYASKFGNKDLDDDIIMPGAFTKSISENGPQGKNTILFLWQHNPGKVLAKPTVLKEDSTGLYYEATISSGATFAEDALKLIQQGLVEENSIGFQTVKSAIMQPDANDWETWYREIYEVNLFEHSAVTWGANPEARMQGMKNRKELRAMEGKLLKALRIDGMRDETYEALELQLKQINTEYYNLGKRISLESKGAAMLTCPNCKAVFESDSEIDPLTDDTKDSVLSGPDQTVECPECKCMFQKALKEPSRKSLMDGFTFNQPTLITGFNF